MYRTTGGADLLHQQQGALHECQHNDPAAPTYAGIDWATDDHAVAIVDPDGVAPHRLTVAHTSVGPRSLITTLRKADVEAVGIERPEGPFVDALLCPGSPSSSSLRTRSRTCARATGSVGNKDDRFDAYVLADTVRTDRHRLTNLSQDSPQTVTLRMTDGSQLAPGGLSPRADRPWALRRLAP